MVDKFEKNKKYKFSKERFISYAKQMINLSPRIHPKFNPWINEIDDLEVEVLGESTGKINDMAICPVWCVEL